MMEDIREAYFCTREASALATDVKVSAIANIHKRPYEQHLP